MLTRYIYPLSLREKISWRIKKFFPDVEDKNISLLFDKNIRLDLSNTDVGHQSIIFNGYYELGLTKRIIALAKKGGVFVDVGANYGYYSCLWASQNPSNKVLAFEASPVNVKPLMNNIEKNGFSKSVTIVPNAVGKEKGILKFNLGNESRQTGWGGLSIDDNSNNIEVEVDTLDNYVKKYGIDKIDVLKIDTEGADTWVLYGAEQLLESKKISHIFFEHNMQRMKLLNIKTDDARIFLEKHGYVVEQNSPEDFYAYPKQ